jgi:predicted RNA methylase
VVTDPPYGCGKADWDLAFPRGWYLEARRLAKMVVIITGACGLKDSVSLVGDDFIDVIAAWNTNSLTRGPLGFNNWLAAVVAGNKPKVRACQNVMRFAVRGDMPDHPSPKPIEYMRLLIARLTLPNQIVLDCFAGSGTTGVACVQTGRSFIGVEIDPGYFAIAQRRIEEAQMQLRMPLEVLPHG